MLLFSGIVSKIEELSQWLFNRTISLFYSIIYWTQKADDDSFQLNIFNLIDNSRTLNNISLNSLAIAEDIQNGCIYVVTEEKVKCKKYNHTDTFTQEIEISRKLDKIIEKYQIYSCCNQPYQNSIFGHVHL